MEMESGFVRDPGKVSESRFGGQQPGKDRINLDAGNVGHAKHASAEHIAPASDANYRGPAMAGQEIRQISHIVFKEPRTCDIAIPAIGQGAGIAIDVHQALLDRPICRLVSRRWAPQTGGPNPNVAGRDSREAIPFCEKRRIGRGFELPLDDQRLDTLAGCAV